MSKRDIYRQRAEDCLLTAAMCKSPERKVFLTAMAHAWHRLAQPQHVAEAAWQQAKAQRDKAQRDKAQREKAQREEEAALAAGTDAGRISAARLYRARG